MRALDFTLNNMTMLAMVLMVGIVIDDAIVVLENVFHCIEEKGMPPMQAAVVGTKEIGLAVLVTTLSLVIVFLPLAFLSSIAGRMLFQFGMTATVSILVSLLVSFTLTPMMCSRLLKPVKATEGGPASRRGFYHWIEVGYLAVLRWSLRWRWVVLLLSLAVIAANWPLYKLVKQDYIPTNVDESEFEVEVVAREGTSLRSMDQLVRAVEAELRAVARRQAAVDQPGLGRLAARQCLRDLRAFAGPGRAGVLLGPAVARDAGGPAGKGLRGELHPAAENAGGPRDPDEVPPPVSGTGPGLRGPQPDVVSPRGPGRYRFLDHRPEPG